MGVFAVLASIISVLTAIIVLTSRLHSYWRKSSHARFVSDRERYEAQRAALNKKAIEWYGTRVNVIGDTAEITCPDWIPSKPIPISNVEVVDDPDPESERALLESLKSSLSRYLPYQVDAYGRFRTRHDAVSVLCRPLLWENRTCYRITQIDLQTKSAMLKVAPVSFFTGFDVSESLAIELLRAKDSRKPATLPLRRQIGQPYDLRRNPVHAAVCTLTIIRGMDGVDRFYMHDRNKSAVADGIGQRHVIPAGVFQPSTDHPAAWPEDRNVWKNIVRESCEEFLPDVSPIERSSAPVDIETVEPYAGMMRQLNAENIQCYLLGIGLDPVQLQPEIFTCCVFDEATFGKIFGATFQQASAHNSEGEIIGGRVIGTMKSGIRLVGFPFSEAGIESMRSAPLVSGALACVYLAWNARAFLLPTANSKKRRWRR